MNRVQFQKLAEVRVREAQALYSQKLYSGAYYLAGYGVECALKACIARLIRRHDFPDRELLRGAYTHDFSLLLKTANLENQYKKALNQNAQLRLHWDTVLNWNEGSRYVRWRQSDARDLIQAITEIPYGVFPWIKQYW